MAGFSSRWLLLALGFLFVFGAGSGAKAQNAYGAIALSPDGAYGYSYNYRTIDQAQDTALNECNKHGRGCAVVRVFENVCVALGTSFTDGTHYANWASGYNAEERRDRVVRSCQRDGGRNCQVRAEFCTGNAR